MVSRCEQLCEVKYDAEAKVYSGKTELVPTSKVMTWLHKLSAAFDRIEWLSATLHYKPFVGTNSTGSIAFGVDWNSDVGTLSREKILAATPVYESPVWQGGNMALPAKMLMTRKFYFLQSSVAADKMPGILMWNLAGATTSSSYGELWVTYKVRLSGTTA